MSQAPEMQVLGVFNERESLETAIQMLQSHGIERSQLTVLGTEDAMRGRLGLDVTPPANPGGQGETPVDESEQQNITPLLAGMPLYIGAVLAGGITVASGGTLAVAAAAALAGAAGGGALGVGAASAMRGSVDESYADQLQKGGIVLLVHPRTPEDLETARRILGEQASRTEERTADRPQT